MIRLWLLFLLLAAPGVAQEARVETLFDFEQRALTDGWGAQGKLDVERAELPPEALAELDPSASERLPGSRGLRVESSELSVLYSKRGLVPADWSDAEELSLWVYRAPDEARRRPSSTFEVQLVEPDRRTRFWSRVVVSHRGWRRVALPLRWFRWSRGKVPDLARIAELRLLFRSAGELWIDAIGVTRGAPRAGSLALRDLAPVAFPGRAAGALRALELDAGWLQTDCVELDLEVLGAHLGSVTAALDEHFPGRSGRPPILIVFADEADYRTFPLRFAERMSSSATEPPSGGYTLQAVATSFWDPAQGSLRPVFTHEFVHAWIVRHLELTCAGGWFQEGLAAHLQLRFHEQRNFPSLVERGLLRARPLQELLNGERIALNDYWQARTVVAFLLDQHHDELPRLIDSFQAAGSTELGPHLGPVLKTSWEQLERAWREWCLETYAE